MIHFDGGFKGFAGDTALNLSAMLGFKVETKRDLKLFSEIGVTAWSGSHEMNSLVAIKID